MRCRRSILTRAHGGPPDSIVHGGGGRWAVKSTFLYVGSFASKRVTASPFFVEERGDTTKHSHSRSSSTGSWPQGLAGWREHGWVEGASRVEGPSQVEGASRLEGASWGGGSHNSACPSAQVPGPACSRCGLGPRVWRLLPPPAQTHLVSSAGLSSMGERIKKGPGAGRLLLLWSVKGLSDHVRRGEGCGPRSTPSAGPAGGVRAFPLAEESCPEGSMCRAGPWNDLLDPSFLSKTHCRREQSSSRGASPSLRFVHRRGVEVRALSPASPMRGVTAECGTPWGPPRGESTGLFPTGPHGTTAHRGGLCDCRQVH